MRTDFLNLQPSEQNDWIEKAAAAARGHTPARLGNVLSPPSLSGAASAAAVVPSKVKKSVHVAKKVCAYDMFILP